LPSGKVHVGVDAAPGVTAVHAQRDDPGPALATGSAQLRSQLHVQSAGMGKRGSTPGHPAGLLTVEEARAGQ
jgi:hypothetical protein